MNLLDKGNLLLGKNKNAAKGAVDQAGDAVDDKTGAKYSDQVDTAQDKAKDVIDKTDGQI